MNLLLFITRLDVFEQPYILLLFKIQMQQNVVGNIQSLDNSRSQLNPEREFDLL